jgi:sulfur-oxidizing protein SoxY
MKPAKPMPSGINPLRRRALRVSSAGIAYVALVATGLFSSARARAADWMRSAFTANTFADALKAHGSGGSAESREVTMVAPEIAENGAQVVIEVSSSLPGSQNIAIFVDKNPMPLAATFSFAGGAVPQVRVPLKMAETSRVRAVVKTADGKLWHAQREIKVTLGGCAG